MKPVLDFQREIAERLKVDVEYGAEVVLLKNELDHSACAIAPADLVRLESVEVELANVLEVLQSLKLVKTSDGIQFKLRFPSAEIKDWRLFVCDLLASDFELSLPLFRLL